MTNETGLPSSELCRNEGATHAAAAPHSELDGGPRARDGDATGASGNARADSMPEQVAFALPYPISANRYWRPVSMGAHLTIVPTTEAKRYRRDVAALVRAIVPTPIAWRVRVELFLFPHRPKDFIDRMRKLGPEWDDGVQCIDLDNAAKVVLDAVKGIAIEDDRWVWEFQSRRMEPDQHGERVVVCVTPLARLGRQGALL